MSLPCRMEAYLSHPNPQGLSIQSEHKGSKNKSECEKDETNGIIKTTKPNKKISNSETAVCFLFSWQQWLSLWSSTVLSKISPHDAITWWHPYTHPCWGMRSMDWLGGPEQGNDVKEVDQPQHEQAPFLTVLQIFLLDGGFWFVTSSLNDCY